MKYTYLAFAIILSPLCEGIVYGTNQITTNDIFNMLVEIQYGEAFDKATILEIKSKFITDPNKLKNILTELAVLNNTLENLMELFPHHIDALAALKTELYETNLKLWCIEDAIRDKEALKSFDEEFIELARSVYVTNDKRCAIKREINLLLDSPLIEEKSYKAY